MFVFRMYFVSSGTYDSAKGGILNLVNGAIFGANESSFNETNKINQPSFNDANVFNPPNNNNNNSNVVNGQFFNNNNINDASPNQNFGLISRSCNRPSRG